MGAFAPTASGKSPIVVESDMGYAGGMKKPVPSDRREPAITDSLSRDPSDPPANRGTETAGIPDEDEKEDIERLVEEGVDVAQDDQMKAARQHREP